MSHKAGAALQVNDLDSTLAFYTHYLDFALVSSQPDVGTALIRDSGGDLLLLVDPLIEEVKSLLAEPCLVFKPGNTLDYLETNLESRHARFLERGLTEAEILQTTSPLGDRRLTITDPNGYRFTFEQTASRTPEQTMALYSRCSDSIVEAIAGLTETDLDLKRAPDEWSIRQIIHHFAESSSMILIPVKIALAQL
jgi:catechol 2,3-dioxygenase-like lactoylglutathione lyase family enzyme